MLEIDCFENYLYLNHGFTDDDSAYFTEMYYNVGLQVYFSNSSKDYGFSIRCLKDEP